MLAQGNEGVEIVRVALPAAVHVVAFLVDMNVSWFLEVASPNTDDRIRIKLAASDGKALVSAAKSRSQFTHA
jgi:hypothetical protein